ncbi:transcription initiation factor TFIID subunit 1-a-like protein, partial [Trifolium pratense]
MGYDSDSASQDGRDEDDEEEYEESDKGNRFLGFMFGNVDNSGDLDVDYLDEDAKEHLSALADKLGPSLTDIAAVVLNLEIKMLSVDLLSGKSPRTRLGIVEQGQLTSDVGLLNTPPHAYWVWYMDINGGWPDSGNVIAGDPTDLEEDCGEKAEDAVDYEDIDEEYDGPETETANEEDHLLPKKDFFAVETSLEALESKISVFDDEDYDEESDKEQDLVNNDAKVDNISLAVEHEESFVDASKGGSVLEHDLQVGSLQTDELDNNVQKPEEGPEVLKRSMATPLPVLYVDDGKAVLRFSEIFGIQEPPRKGEKKERRHSTPR